MQSSSLGLAQKYLYRNAKGNFISEMCLGTS